MLESFNHMLLLITVLGALSIVSTRLSFRAGAPVLLVFLLVGLLAGEDGIGGIAFDDARGAYVIGSIALALILFDSGFGTPIGTLRRAAAPALTLATVGVAVTTVVFAAVARWLLDLPWIEALLLGAILSSTDAAAVFFLLRVGGLALRERVRSTLEIESGSNDPMAVFLVLALLPLALAGSAAIEPTMVLDFAREMGIGVVTGVLGGMAMTGLLNRLDLDGGLHPLLAAMIALALFAVTNLIDGSGFLAAYVAGLVAGHRARQRVNELRRFQNGVTWLAQIAMFLTLGLLATPSEFPAVMAPALLLGVFLIAVARPMAVWLCLLPFRTPWEEIVFIGLIGLRGAVSILLAIVPMIGGLEHGRLLFNVAFIVVLVSLIVQGWALAPLARLLRLVVPGRTGPIDRVELDLPLEGAHELVAYRLAGDSPLITQRRMPRWMHPALVVREGRSIRNVRVDKLQKGDVIYVFVRPHRVPLLDRLIASPRAPDKSDREFYGDFAVEPDTPILELAEFYGAEVHAQNRSLTVAEFLQREFGLGIEPGDRIGLGTIELIVRERDRFGRVTDVGMSVIAKTSSA
jgi:cell volume regulation protein A